MKEKTYFLITAEELEVLVNHYVEQLYEITEQWNDIEKAKKNGPLLKETADRYLQVIEALEEARAKEKKTEEPTK